MPCRRWGIPPATTVRDVLPGDRASGCRGLMRPIAVTTDAKRGFVITHKCVKCGHTRNNRAQKDDDTDLLIRMTNPHYFDGAGKP